MKRVVGLVLGVAVAIVGTKVVVEDILGFSLEAYASSWIVDAGSGTALVVAGLLAIDIFVPVPSSLVMVLSGAAFGTVWGSLLSLTGSIAGEWLGFEIARRWGRGVSARMVGPSDLDRLDRVFSRHGVLAIVVTRALPVVMETMSVVAGLSTMSRMRFLLASFAGTAPIALAYAYAGHASRATGSVVPAIVILTAVAATAWLWFRSKMSS